MNQETCWTLIAAVHEGDSAAREDFVARYLPPVRAYLAARWKGTLLSSECEDAVQEVFMRCFAEAGPLERVDALAEAGFRGFLYGMCRNVARELERKHQRKGKAVGEALDESEGKDERLSRTFDRAFAQQVMREARARYKARSRMGDEAARKRFELLSLRFEQDLPIRTIAERWNADPARVHKEYARARREYRQTLMEIVAEQNPGQSAAQAERAAKDLLEILS